jgi:hypothetical protein
MSDLHYIVSQQDAGYEGEWNERAAFRWFADAKAYAIRASKADNLERFVRVSRDDWEPNYFMRGQPADYPYGEVEA